MNATDWRRHGFKVMFRGDRVVLVNIPCEIIHVAPNNGDKWMLHDDLTEFPWETRKIKDMPPDSRKDVTDTIAGCYCDSLFESTCDFCSGLRRAGEATAAARIITREVRGGAVIIEYEDGLGNTWVTQFKTDAEADKWCTARHLSKGGKS